MLMFAFALNHFSQTDTSKTNHQSELDAANALLAKNPQNVSALTRRANFYVSQKDFTRAMVDYDEVIRLNPNLVEAYIGRGYIYLQNNSYGQAIKEFNRAIEIDPKNEYALESRAYCQEVMLRSNLSFEEYDALIQFDPTKAEYYYYRGKLYFKAKKFIKATEDYSQAIEINQTYADAYISRAASYCEGGKRKESLADIRKYEQLSGKKNRGTCALDIKQCPKADDVCLMELYTEGINNPKEISSNEPNSLGFYYAGRGIINYERGKFDEAFSDFEKANFMFGDKRKGLYYGKLLFQNGKYEEALRNFNSALPDPEAALGIGEIHLIRREYGKALVNYEKAIFLNPRLSKAYLGRGAIYLKRGDDFRELENDESKAVESYRNAVKDFDSVIEIDLQNVGSEVYEKRAKAYERLNEPEKAAADRAKAEEVAEKP